MCKILSFLDITAYYQAPIRTLGVTTERNIFVCLPFKKEMYCTVHRPCVSNVLILFRFCPVHMITIQRGST
ncbi:hypothetical protein MAR_023380 [Mya arenaria]|uniref:Uncharacterized protein n=1 Tax=Mya arenaria TaxID=6604 RepID=A0ABY7DMU4_MYAAR|nr:hypothetical protein MAR_023380 [Mya arenaria]